MLGGPEGLVILVIILVLFGGSQLPKLAKNVGKAQKEFRMAMDEANSPASSPAPAAAPAAAFPAPTAAPQSGPANQSGVG